MRRVAVIGAGVIGMSVAHACAERGDHVTLIERGSAERNGCSFGNLGMVVPSHFIPLAAPGMVALGLRWMWNPESPFYIKPRFDPRLFLWGLKFWSASSHKRVEAAAPVLRDLHLLSREGFRELAARGLEFGLVENGLMMLCKTERALDEEGRTAHMAQRLGIPANVLDAKQAAALDPGVTLDIAGAVHFPKDCHLQPERYMAALNGELVQQGAVFRCGSPVSDWRVEGGAIRAVITPDGDIEADEFVLCSGVWSEKLARTLKLALPMQAGKGYTLTLCEPPELPAICAICKEARVAVTPMGASVRFGGTMEMAGINESVNVRRVRGIIKAASEYYPAFKPALFEDIHVWSGLRPCSPDGLPYLGRTRKWRNLTIATGHAMMGLSLAPATGRIVAQLLHGESPSIDLKLLSPDRY